MQINDWFCYMDDLKNDSVFVLKVIVILAGFCMFIYSKTGTYLVLLFGMAGNCGLMYALFGLPFWNHFMVSVLAVSPLFEMVYPRLSRRTEADLRSVTEEYDNARSELSRRKNLKNRDLN